MRIHEFHSIVFRLQGCEVSSLPLKADPKESSGSFWMRRSDVNNEQQSPQRQSASRKTRQFSNPRWDFWKAWAWYSRIMKMENTSCTFWKCENGLRVYISSGDWCIPVNYIQIHVHAASHSVCIWMGQELFKLLGGFYTRQHLRGLWVEPCRRQMDLFTLHIFGETSIFRYKKENSWDQNNLNSWYKVKLLSMQVASLDSTFDCVCLCSSWFSTKQHFQFSLD